MIPENFNAYTIRDGDTFQLLEEMVNMAGLLMSSGAIPKERRTAELCLSSSMLNWLGMQYPDYATNGYVDEDLDPFASIIEFSGFDAVCLFRILWIALANGEPDLIGDARRAIQRMAIRLRDGLEGS